MHGEVSSVTDVVGKPTEESIRAAFAEGRREAAFWRAHYDEYVAAYPDQFVAVTKDDNAVVAASPTLDGVIRLAEARGVALGSIWIEFIFATPLHVSL